jgi:hypothetical protein
LSKGRKKSAKTRKTPYDARQLRLPVHTTPHERKLAAQAAATARNQEAEEELADDDEGFVRPWRHRLYNALIGLGFVPFAIVLTLAVWRTFASIKHNGPHLPFYKTHECVSLIVGGFAWMVIFVGSLAVRTTPLLTRVYVIGHEFMHAWLAGFFFKGRIKEFKADADGGYIVTDKYNFLIALAPYLWPIYCIPVLAVWGVAGWFPWGTEYTGTFFAALGFTWTFHLSFTVWMLSKGQSDLLGPGRIFSLVLIYIVNVAMLAAFVITMAPEFSWRAFGSELWNASLEFYHALAGIFVGHR